MLGRRLTRNVVFVASVTLVLLLGGAFVVLVIFEGERSSHELDETQSGSRIGKAPSVVSGSAKQATSAGPSNGTADDGLGLTRSVPGQQSSSGEQKPENSHADSQLPSAEPTLGTAHSDTNSERSSPNSAPDQGRLHSSVALPSEVDYTSVRLVGRARGWVTGTPVAAGLVLQENEYLAVRVDTKQFDIKVLAVLPKLTTVEIAADTSLGELAATLAAKAIHRFDLLCNLAAADSLPALIGSLHALEHLTLGADSMPSSCVTQELLEVLGKSERLRTLDTFMVYDRDLVESWSKFFQQVGLRQLSVRMTLWELPFLEALFQCKSLVELRVLDFMLPKDSPQALELGLTTLIALKTFWITANDGASWTVSALRCPPNLVDLRIEAPYVHINEIAKCVDLQSLSLGRVSRDEIGRAVSSSSQKVFLAHEFVFNYLARLKKLRHIGATGWWPESTNLQELAQLPVLESIGFGGLEGRAAENVLDQVVSLPGVRKIGLEASPCIAAVSARLTRFTRLECVEIVYDSGDLGPLFRALDRWPTPIRISILGDYSPSRVAALATKIHNSKNVVIDVNGRVLKSD